jgi:hypothetical protein
MLFSRFKFIEEEAAKMIKGLINENINPKRRLKITLLKK